jgi:hypothetical protein
MSAPSDVILSQWRHSPDRYTAEEALERLRQSWSELSRGLCSRHRARVVSDNPPIMSSLTPWWQYRPGTDIVEPVSDPENLPS